MDMDIVLTEPRSEKQGEEADGHSTKDKVSSLILYCLYYLVSIGLLFGPPFFKGERYYSKELFLSGCLLIAPSLFEFLLTYMGMKWVKNEISDKKKLREWWNWVKLRVKNNVLKVICLAIACIDVVCGIVAAVVYLFADLNETNILSLRFIGKLIEIDYVEGLLAFFLYIFIHVFFHYQINYKHRIK
ncbi:MAG: hypothetical protein IKS21_07565 [Oscillospiraceae bacterium]|nr:hypothetical protein [Oscillospiraceae bacterium]